MAGSPSDESCNIKSMMSVTEKKKKNKKEEEKEERRKGFHYGYPHSTIKSIEGNVAMYNVCLILYCVYFFH